MKKFAVVLLNLGGPDSLEAIEPFLKNLFSDPDIFKIPFGQKWFAKIISKKRAPIVAEQYKKIGGKSPINEWTETQRKMLKAALRKDNINADVFTAMRYWKPLTEETVRKVEDGGYEKIILLPLYPHYSVSTTGSSFNEWKRHYKGDESKVIFIERFFNDGKYIDALNERIDKTLMKFGESIRSEVVILFSAHGTPVSMVKKGDPYSREIDETVRLVMKRRNDGREYRLAYQSKVGPAKWLDPSTDKMIETLAAEGRKHLLVVPISFTSDHIETLFELDIEYRRVAENCGVENYIVMEGLNDLPLFIEALKEIVMKEI
jgi:ferrochelatase